MRLVVDVVRFCAAEMPKFHPVSVSGYHIREAGLDGGPGVGLHPRQRVRLRRGRHGRRAVRRRVRAPAELLLQRPSRLLRGDRQVPGRPAHLGPLDGGPLRRHVAPLAAAPVPHPDRRGLAHRPAARGEHRPHRHRGPRRRARRDPEPPHQLDGRGPGPAHREGGPHRAAHAAGHRPRDRGHQRVRPPRRVVVRGVTHRRDRTPGRGDLRPARRVGRGVDARGRAARDREQLVPGRDRRCRLRLPAQGGLGPPRRGRGERLHRGQRGARAADAAHRARGRRSPAQAAGRRQANGATSARSTPPWPPWRPTPRWPR